MQRVGRPVRARRHRWHNVIAKRIGRPHHQPSTYANDDSARSHHDCASNQRARQHPESDWGSRAATAQPLIQVSSTSCASQLTASRLVLRARPPADEERERVQTWLRGLRGTGRHPMFRVVDQQSRLLASLSVPEKASRVVQAPCNSCETIVASDGSLPLSVTFPINVEPWSSQSWGERVIIRNAVTRELARSGRHKPYTNGPLCVSVVSLVPLARRQKDVDNLVKGLLDSLQGILYEDDNQIQCLTSRRLPTRGTRGNYLVSADAVHPWSSDVVYDDGRAPYIATGQRVEPPSADGTVSSGSAVTG